MTVLDELREVLATARPVPMKCLAINCDGVYVAGSTSGTVGLVGYSSPPGHNHDDNCRCFMYVCSEGHGASLSPRNRCYKTGCGWIGKSECFCTNIVDKLPEVDQDSTAFLRRRRYEGLPVGYVRKNDEGVNVGYFEEHPPKQVVVSECAVTFPPGLISTTTLPAFLIEPGPDV